MLALFGRRKVSDEQGDRVKRRCAGVQKAYEVCVKANSGETVPCQYLETSLVSCNAEVICPQEAKDHGNCIRKMGMDDPAMRTGAECDVYVEHMRRCLKGYGVYPFKTASGS